MKRFILLFCSAALLLASCNKDKDITEDIPLKPVIELDSETGIYTVKKGRTLTISPTITNGENAIIIWKLDGKIVSREPTYTAEWSEIGDFFVTLSVQNEAGEAQEELKVEVLALAPPVISLTIPSEGLKVVAGVDYVLAPTIRHDDMDGFKIEWVRNGQVVSTEKTYTFNESVQGVYPITIHASNIDGTATREVAVEVVKTMPYSVEFPAPSYSQTGSDRYTFAGRPVYLTPLLAYFDHPQFSWSIDGTTVSGETGSTFRFTPSAPGDYRISVTVSENLSRSENISRHITRAGASLTVDVYVHCVEGTEADGKRASGASSSPYQNKVYEWTPAPGQFIGETGSGGMTGNETTLPLANAWAEERLTSKNFVSLGGFGGYIVVGFDHSIARTASGYDFAIMANAFSGSNEPGIVWVMQDINGNGRPDDEWYELKGSETGKEETIQNYAVTYYRPAGPGMNVEWTDSEGNSGHIDYLMAYHRQDYYYPAWVTEDAYTLRGTCLPSKNQVDPVTGYWKNEAYEWGYADNKGTDNLPGGSSGDGSGQRNGFKISNAIYPDGSPAGLQYVDFIKVQVAVNAKSGWLGELSTEVFSFEDLSLNN